MIGDIPRETTRDAPETNEYSNADEKYFATKFVLNRGVLLNCFFLLTRAECNNL